MTKITERFRSFQFHIDRNIITYGICVAIASVLWFLNALNKEYTTKISYPVKYTDFPRGKFLVSDPPQHISLEVRANGFTLLAYRLQTSFRPIVVNINSYSKYSLDNNNVLNYSLNLNDTRDKIGSQLHSGIKLLSIIPGKVDLTFSPAVSRKIAVYPVVHYTLKKQYILTEGIHCTPDSILVSGPAQIMDTLKYIYTDPWDAGEIKKTRTQTVALRPHPGIQFNNTDIRIEMEPERYTEVSRSIPVEVLNLPDSLEIKLFPGTVEITYEIGLSKYDAVKDSDFAFTVDYKDVYDDTYLPVQVTRSPKYIKDLRYTPQRVEFILEKK